MQAYWLNGRGVGARWDGTFNYEGQGSYHIGSCDGARRRGSMDQIQGQDRANLRDFINAQMVAYDKADGWIFWTWKTESAPEWDYRALANAGVIPVPPNPYSKSYLPPSHLSSSCFQVVAMAIASSTSIVNLMACRPQHLRLRTLSLYTDRKFGSAFLTLHVYCNSVRSHWVKGRAETKLWFTF